MLKKILQRIKKIQFMLYYKLKPDQFSEQYLIMSEILYSFLLIVYRRKVLIDFLFTNLNIDTVNLCAELGISG
jgi:hypothetical protein